MLINIPNNIMLSVITDALMSAGLSIDPSRNRDGSHNVVRSQVPVEVKADAARQCCGHCGECCGDD